IYGPEGDLRNTYPGSLLGVSPSATKILLDGGIWLDLSNGKTVDFDWQQTDMAADYSVYGQSHSHPIWSPDEMRVYNCCYMYGDARTGASLVMSYDGITLDGEKAMGNFEVFGGTWVLKDKYVLPIWGGAWDGRYSAVYLFDPAARTYRNLSKMAELPDYPGDGPYCNRPSAQTGGRYVWVDCRDGSYLIDLATFTSQVYPPFGRPYGESSFEMPDAEWSADGNFVWFDQEKSESILSAGTKEMKLLPENCSGFEWHPKDNVLLCTSNDGQSLLLVDAQTVSILKETTLPARFYKMGWSADGKHVTLLAKEDNSLWQIDYPNLDHLEQLTLAMPELIRQTDKHNIPLIKNVIWSPDDMDLAFIGAEHIYVIHVGGTR
ncbi:MAG TPA: hypothetical protein VHP14_09700, partial [Anaerolineales bacterium]|nr:hypothetical protein [Anaerolineales bacterium]